MPKSVASSVAPEAPPGVDDLPVEYKVRRCKYCKAWSTSLSPWPLTGTVLSSWSPMLPWAKGTRNKPTGECCKPCMVVIWWHQN